MTESKHQLNKAVRLDDVVWIASGDRFDRATGGLQAIDDKDKLENCIDFKLYSELRRDRASFRSQPFANSHEQLLQVQEFAIAQKYLFLCLSILLLFRSILLLPALSCYFVRWIKEFPEKNRPIGSQDLERNPRIES